MSGVISTVMLSWWLGNGMVIGRHEWSKKAV